MNTKRGRPGIKPQVKGLIYARALESKKIPRLALAVELRDLIKRMGEKLPTEETIMRLISQARNREPNPKDAPWSLGTLTKYNLPPEAIRIIFEVQEWRLLNNKKPLTICEAWWVSNLSAFIKSTKVLPITRVLFFWASSYAIKEQICELTGMPMDTSSLDAIVGRYAEEYATYPNIWEKIVVQEEDYDKAVKIVCALINIRSKALECELSKQEKEVIDLAEQAEQEDREVLGIVLTAKYFFPPTESNISFLLDKLDQYYAGKVDEIEGGNQ